jgi:hypothetical protein
VSNVIQNDALVSNLHYQHPPLDISLKAAIMPICGANLGFGTSRRHHEANFGIANQRYENVRLNQSQVRSKLMDTQSLDHENQGYYHSNQQDGSYQLNNELPLVF